jgi:NADPH2:quinone reductase
MVNLRRSVIVDAPIERVWEVLRDFNGHDSWHPTVSASLIEEGATGDTIGAVRDFRLVDGSRIREQLLALSDRETSFAYCILEAPVALRNYVAMVKLRPVTMEDRCLWEWSARFEPPASDKQRLTQLIERDIFEAGFRAIRSLLKGGSLTPRSLPQPVAPVNRPGPESSIDATSVVATRHGGPEVLAVNRARVAAPGPGEVRIQQTAIGVNFIDVYARRGSLALIQPPAVLGMEAAGIVESAGPGVPFRKGDRVGYACAPPGSYASMRTMAAALLVALPDFLSEQAAASLLLKGISASFLLHDVYAVKKGDIVLVHAAAGGVGLILCRWAAALGATVIGTTSSAPKGARARQAGCSEVILYNEEDFVAATLRSTAGRGVDVVYDAVGKTTFEGSVRSLAPTGHLVSFGQASGDVGLQSIDALTSRSVTLSRPNYGHYTDTPAKLQRQTERLFAALQAGTVVADPPTLYRLEEARAAHEDLENRNSMGALVLIP